MSARVTVLLLLVAPRCIDSLECYACADIANINECLVTSQCQSRQSCFTSKLVSGQDTRYSLGCTDYQLCGVQSNSQPELVGREISSRETSCHECCSSERCNNQLCIHFKPTTCIDDAKVDCAYMNAMFNICKDIQHSKTVCPNFCGLCQLVDGNWAQWTQWSSCDVTCEAGKQTRTRTCTDPAPANKGLDCVGNNTETKPCIKQPCPGTQFCV
ncbi:coadhesin-like [Mercenaria mercenaria]|uniref:coadhesin-like n=1 Tax=Mercenaria mercenaria TaxID=6596 RepID=UPI00234EDB2C|nr:coadhesin-like [Mercenaria mercenaria]